jgi:methionyl-tRNA formyltransferase
MRIIILLNEDIHSATALNIIFPHIKNYQIRIILSQKVGKISDISSKLHHLQQFEQNKLRTLFKEIDNSSDAHKLSEKFKTFKQIANFFQSEISYYEDINSETALADFRKFAPDLVISIRFGQIFHSPIIKIPKHGIINLHSGILPNFRGIMPSFWSVLKGEIQIGTTLHYVEDSSIDTGSIIGFSYVDINKDHSLVFNINQLYEGGCKLLVKHLNDIDKGLEVGLIAQSSLGKGKYFSYPCDLDIENFLKIMPLTRKEDEMGILGKWV